MPATVLKKFCLPEKSAEKSLCYLTREDISGLVECHNRLAAKTHGMMEKTSFMMGRIFDDPENRVVAYKEHHNILAYLIYRFNVSPIIFRRRIFLRTGRGSQTLQPLYLLQ